MYELENNNSINFLDLTIIKKNKSIITNWFQKLTSSGRVINVFSNHPIQQKKNIIYNLVDRALLLSQKSFHKANLRKVKTIILNNDYPLEFINQNIRNRRIYTYLPDASFCSSSFLCYIN